MEHYLTLHKQRHAKQPFFMYMAYQQAHLPNDVDDYHLSKLLERCAACADMSEARQTHLGEQRRSHTWMPPDDGCWTAQVLSVDDSVDYIVNRMKDLQLYNNTIFLFTSDVSYSFLFTSMLFTLTRMGEIYLLAPKTSPWKRASQVHTKVARGFQPSFTIPRQSNRATSSTGNCIIIHQSVSYRTWL